MNPLQRFFPVFCAALVLAAAPAKAANFLVRMVAEPAVPTTRWVFNPTNISINAGDSITWSNAHAAAAHDTTAGIANSGISNGWASPLLTNASGVVFSFTFTSAGNYPYRCRRHTDTGSPALHTEQTGMVSVATLNLPPTVSLTNPASGAAFAAPAAFTLAATATDNGSVTNVQFRSGATPLGNDTNAPFTLLITNLAAGNYSFTAVATDNTGLLGTSPPVTVFVVTNSEITNIQLLPGGAAVLSVLGIAGQTYFIDVTTNFSNWQAIATNVPAANSFTFTNTNVTGLPARLYRSRQVAQ